MSDNYDLVGNIIAYEEGEMSSREIVDFFSYLGKTGVVHGLQGSYGRSFEMLVNSGYLDINGEILKYGD